MAEKIKKIMPRVAFQRLCHLYSRMEESYLLAAREIGLSCTDCPDNCCTSYFQHHTRVEWAYFIKGLNQIHEHLRQRITMRAESYIQQAQLEMSQGRTPDIMCPVNEDGMCTLYAHRLMICRLHGVPNVHIRPDGKTFQFPGCFRAQKKTGSADPLSRLDRTPFYRELAALEKAFVGPRIARFPRVRLTLAEMIVQGPPKMSV